LGGIIAADGFSLKGWPIVAVGKLRRRRCAAHGNVDTILSDPEWVAQVVRRT